MPVLGGAPSAPRAAARAARIVTDVGAVLLTWALVVLAEFVVVGAAYSGLFAGNWELVLGRKLVGPIALAALAPSAPLVVALGHLAARAGRAGARGRGARLATASVAAASALALGVGVTHGRHFARLDVRAAFAVTLGALAFALAHLVVPPAVRALHGPSRRALALTLGLGGLAELWLVDGHVLVRLYPAFHAALLALGLGCASLTVLAWRGPGANGRRVPREEAALGLVGLLLASASLAWAPTAARRLARSDNLRLVLDEHAPILGRAVHVAAWLAPPASSDPSDDAEAATSAPLAGEVPRALDWSGDDILLVSVDALRADHLGAYGYPRATTPNLDALATESAVFERAYCPTPHTSYSVTSMMTGKAMRPLLSLGLGKGSDTWATVLRRYGYKTAAFYPPAVFYIDAERFSEFESQGLGFEYRWVEFTPADEKVREVGRYLETAGPEPVFLWVHLFEPHEPYVVHEGHTFGAGGKAGLPVDAYDSEVAYADAAIGELLRVVRAKRPKATVIVTADHGEELGDHGGRYHGTTCYEEQVRVPLLVSGPGVKPRRVTTVAQTIDLLPTVLSALGIPRPARVRGRDLGPVLAGTQPGPDPGTAYAETDDQTLLAQGDDRLVCARKVGACALYDVAKDPAERHDRAADAPARARELRRVMAGIERDQGRYEAADVAWPDALRRGLQGEGDAADDVAALLDDAKVVIRRKAAEVTFRLAVESTLPQARRAFARDEDEEVRRWAALATVRISRVPVEGVREWELAGALVHDADVKWRRVAALAFAVHRDARGKEELARWWQAEGPPRPGLDMAEAKELLDALGRIQDADALPSLVASLDYVPLRANIAFALGAIQDRRAVAPLLGLFRAERYETARHAEATVLCGLGAGEQVRGPLTMYAGLPDPLTSAVYVANLWHLLDAKHGGVSLDPPALDVEAHVRAPAGPRRLWVAAIAEGGTLTGDVDGVPLGAVVRTKKVYAVDLPDGVAADVALHLHESTGIVAVWVVPRLEEVPAVLRPPLPDAGAEP